MVNILVIDDERNIRLTLKNALASQSTNVFTAMNGEEALSILGTTSFDLVLLDLKLPGFSGLEVLQKVRDQSPGLPVIVISAHGTVESAVDAMKYGASDFLQKPFSATDIRAVIEKHLSTPPGERKVLSEARQVTAPIMSVPPPPTLEESLRTIFEAYHDHRHAVAHDLTARAMAAFPDAPELINLMGAFVEMQGDWLKAQKFYRSALEMDPTFEPARLNLDRSTTLEKKGEIHLGLVPGKPGREGLS